MGRSAGAAAVRCWAARLAVLALIAAAVVPASAGAHGGYQIAAGTNGPYGVVVRARPSVEGGRKLVDVTAYVVRQRLGEPDLTTDLTLRLSGPDGTRTVRPRVVGDGYEAILPVDDLEVWRSWTVAATVRGVDGTTTVTGGPLGAPPGAPAWVPWAGGAAILALLGAGGFLARRRRSAELSGDADDVDDWASTG